MITFNFYPRYGIIHLVKLSRKIEALTGRHQTLEGATFKGFDALRLRIPEVVPSYAQPD